MGVYTMASSQSQNEVYAVEINSEGQLRKRVVTPRLEMCIQEQDRKFEHT